MTKIVYNQEIVDVLIGTVVVNSNLFANISLEIGGYNHKCSNADPVAKAILHDMHTIIIKNVSDKWGKYYFDDDSANIYLQHNSKVRTVKSLANDGRDTVISIYKSVSKVVRNVYEEI